LAEAPLTARVVEVLADLGAGHEPRYRAGSGCIVAGRTVLTAAHVVAGAAGVQVRDPGKVLHPAVVDPAFVGDADGPGPDLALVQITGPGVGELPPVGLAAVDRDSVSGDPVEGCHVVGYPQFTERFAADGGRVRDTADALGHVPVLSGLAGGLLTVEVRTAPRPLPPGQTALGNSEWSGMSGAPVIADGLVLAVVTEHAPRAGPSAISATPLTALEADPAHPRWGPGVADPGAWWARLGVPGLQALRKLPDRGRRPGASRPVRLAPRPVFLADRDHLLAELQRRLSRRDGADPRIVALCGLGGAGKTSVAIEYARRQLAGIGLVWQFPAEEPAAMAAGFGELAALLGVRDVAGGGDPLAAVHAALAARPGGWLLIFDNAPDAAAVAAVLPPAGDGQVIITSQSPHWPGDRAVEVPVLDQDVAAGFLLDRTGDHDHAPARELAGELGGLPLALEQAAAYMLAAGRDIAGYLALYRQRRADMLARGDPAGYDKRVTTTWTLAFARLQEHTPAAVGLLRLLACCAADAIPYRLLLQPRPGLADELPPEAGPVLAPLLADPLAVDDTITALRRYSLISPPASGVVSVHRLVQAITLAQLSDQQAAAWQQASAALITAALPGDPEQPANWPAYAALLPHARAALPLSSTQMMDMAGYLGYSGSYAAARDLSQQILDARQHELGAEHPATLTARANLASWTGQAGDAAGARDQFAALLPVVERVSGAEHPDTLTDRGNLAHWTGQAGDAAGARDQYAALLPLRERVSGAEHPDTLTDRANLAHWTGNAGDPAAARDQYAALLPLRERVSGAEHPDTLTDRGNLAHWTRQADNGTSE
jgi:Trypsin-like peptidase domain/Tetratricopeptide repeat